MQESAASGSFRGATNKGSVLDTQHPVLGHAGLLLQSSPSSCRTGKAAVENVGCFLESRIKRTPPTPQEI